MRKLAYLIVVIVALGLIIAGCIPTTPIVNLTPEITTDPVRKATVGMEYTYDVDATDPDGDALTYSLAVKLTGMIINPATGLIKWIPVTDQVGKNLVTVKVSDGALSDTQSFNISVTVREPMEITVNLPTFTVGEPYWFTVNMIANSDSGKLVVAHFGVPTSTSGNGIIKGTLETGEGSDLIFALTGDVFQTGVFTMGDVTAHFRGTFTKEGTYSTTLKVKTIGGFLLCKEVIGINVIAERTIAIRWLEDAIRFNAIGEVTNSWLNDTIPGNPQGTSAENPATLNLTDGEYHFADVNDFYNTYLPGIKGSVVIDGTGQLTGSTTYTYQGFSIKNDLVGQVEIVVYKNGTSGTMVGTYTQWKYVYGAETEVLGKFPKAIPAPGQGEDWWFVGRTEYIAHGEEELTP